MKLPASTQYRGRSSTIVITTPMIVYRHGDDVPGGRIRRILVYKESISHPDRNVENPDDSDLLKHSVRTEGHREGSLNTTRQSCDQKTAKANFRSPCPPRALFLWKKKDPAHRAGSFSLLAGTLSMLHFPFRSFFRLPLRSGD
jgi:hypothetical protein